MKYLIRRYYSETQITHHVEESDKDTQEFLNDLGSKTIPEKIEIYKLVAEQFYQ